MNSDHEIVDAGGSVTSIGEDRTPAPAVPAGPPKDFDSPAPPPFQIPGPSSGIWGGYSEDKR